MKNIKHKQVAAMNILYKFFPLTRFLDDVLISVLLCNSAVAENVIVILYNKIAFLSIATKAVGVLAGGVVRTRRSMFPHFTKKRTPQMRDAFSGREHLPSYFFHISVPSSA